MDQMIRFPWFMMLTLASRGPDATRLRTTALHAVEALLHQRVSTCIVPAAASWRRSGRRNIAASHKWFLGLRGECDVIVPHGRHRLVPGASLLIPRGVQHDEQALPGTRDYLCVLLITGGGQLRVFDVRAERNDVAATALVRLPHPLADRLARRLDAAVEASSGSGPYAQAEAEALMQAALALLATLLTAEPKQPNPQPAAVRHVLRAIEQRADDPGLTVAQLARDIGLDPDWLTVLVRRSTGRTPRDLLIDRRLTLARELLTESGQTIASVAALAGFRSQGHFSQIFRQRCGSSPGDWRRTMADA